MPLKNYSTTVPAEKTIAEIEQIITRHGATDVWKEYENGAVVGFNFVVPTRTGKIPFKLPINAEKIRDVLIREKEHGNLPSLSKKTARDIDHARRIGWRIIKDWIYSQISLIEIGQVKLEEVFLPYVYDPQTKQTLFQRIETGEVKLLPEGELK